MSLLDLVASFFRRHELTGAPGVIAVSGGPDSVGLALILHHLQQPGFPGKLTVAHLNHLLRGPESDADETFVHELARQWGVTCKSARVDVAAEAGRRGDNLENTARQLRYDWLAQIAREQGAVWIAVGHTADDQAETVLHHLLRGSGLTGLAGMAERRRLAPGIDLVRPLLAARRQDILDYLEKQQQRFRQDSSNLDPRFTRNRLRRELLPHLAEHYNPAIVEVLCHLADQARAVQEEVTALAEGLLEVAELPRAGDLVIVRAEPLSTAPRHRIREVFRLIWQREGWPLGEMTFEAWQRLADVAAGTSTTVDCPGGVRARRVGRVIQMGRSGPPI